MTLVLGTGALCVFVALITAMVYREHAYGRERRLLDCKEIKITGWNLRALEDGKGGRGK